MNRAQRTFSAVMAMSGLQRAYLERSLRDMSRNELVELIEFATDMLDALQRSEFFAEVHSMGHGPAFRDGRRRLSKPK
jgi:hypothetical protein